MTRTLNQLGATPDTYHIPEADANSISVHVEELLSLHLPKIALVIEDEPLIKDFAAESFEDASIPVVYTAMTIAVARQIVEQYGNDIGLIYCDFKLPDGQGYDFIKEIRAKGIDAPVIFSSGSDKAEILDKITGISDTVVLLKPFGLDGLEEARRQGISLFNQLQGK